MKAMTLNLTLALSMIAFVSPASAKTMKPTPSSCDTVQALCKAKDLKFQEVFDVSEGKVTDGAQPVLAPLENLAKRIAHVWGDTILEGDYHSDGATRLDRVEAFYSQDQVVAYRITYSERAWYTGDCGITEQGEYDLKTCQEGRIVESSYVVPDLSDWTNDDMAYAEFE